MEPTDKYLRESIIKKMLEGKSVKQIAYETRLPPTTVYTLRDRFPLFKWASKGKVEDG